MPSLSAPWRSPRFRLWGVLLTVLAGSIVLLVLGLAREGPGPPAPAPPLRFPVLDETGEPVQGAVVYVKRHQGEVTTPGTRWNPRTATLTLEPADRGATLIVAAQGYRVRRLDDVQEGRPVVLREGLRVRLQVTGDAPPVRPPLVGLFRIRPTPETAKLARLDDAARFDLDLAELMSVLYRNRPNAEVLPVERFGFAASEDDAASGVMLPLAGSYEVRWGLLDEGPRTWFTLEDGPKVVISVPEAGEGTVYDVPITRSIWARTREGLRQRVEEQRAGR